MIQIESSSTTTFELQASGLSSTFGLSKVPRDVISKYDVEAVNTEETVEALMNRKISEGQVPENEPFYIINLNTIVKKFEEWQSALPRVKPFYAMKCNPNIAIIRTLASLGVNFDCASKTEIQTILGCGVSSKRIIYANPCKMVSHIQYAKASDVEMMTFDNAAELTKIAEVYPEAKLVLRIITDDSQSICRFSTKFGAPLDKCPSLLAHAKELGLNVMGVSFHVGSGCMNPQSFCSAIKNAHAIFKQAEEYGFHMSLLDLGGGWPGTGYEGISFAEVAQAIRPLIDELFPENIEVIAEPGRYFVAQSHTLAVNVYAKREVVHNGEKSFLYYINDGVYQSFNCIIFDHYSPKPLILNSANQRTELYRATIFGPTCDSMDCVNKDILIPEVEVGDWLYFRNMGAYSVAAASPFNGFKSCPTLFYIH
jgi:ornithine decarboxylase